MRSIRLVVVLLSVAIVTPLLAGNPEKLKEWDQSPQGYFMTKAEHQEWTAIQTDVEAQRFVDQFLAKRGPGFAAEVASRAEQADKHLTLGKLAGSKTLRGKLVILLGPPSGLDVSDVVDNSSAHRDSPDIANAYTGGGVSAGGNYDRNEAGRTMGVGSLMRLYHFTYASTPAGPLDVSIAADGNKGTDRPRDRETSKRLDVAFEAVAQASIKTK